MVILNDSVLKIDGYLKGLKRNDNEVRNISGANDCKDDLPFEYLYILTTTTGTVPFYSLWDGKCLVSTGTSFDDAKKNLDKYNKKIKHHNKHEKEYTDENGNKYVTRKLFKKVEIKVPVIDEPPYHYNFKASRR